MKTEKKLYSYAGEVFLFDTIIARKWKGTTYAVSPAKAKTNLEYRFKMENGYIAGTRIQLAEMPKLNV